MDDKIIIRGAREHNLKNIDLELPRGKFIVFTGISGSGKSTLAMDTIFAEGQRRYLESLSSYARQFLGQMKKPDVESIEGLSPAIAVDQKTASHNPRSTVGTVTEIYDYLRLLYAKIGTPTCLQCGREIQSLTIEQMAETVVDDCHGLTVTIYAPVVRGRKGEYLQLLNEFYLKGYTKARLNGKFVNLKERVALPRYKSHTIDIVIDTVKVNADALGRIFEALEQATKLTDGLALVEEASLVALRLGSGNKNMVLPEQAKRVEGPPTSRLFNQRLNCPYCDLSFQNIEPRLFSFNSPVGMCQQCKGLGSKQEIDPDRVIPDKNKTIEEGGILSGSYTEFNYYGAILRALQERYALPANRRIKDLADAAVRKILYGEGQPFALRIKFYIAGRPRVATLTFNGLLHHLKYRAENTESEAVRQEIEGYMSKDPCPSCHGTRLREEALHVLVGGKHIAELTSLSIAITLAFVQNLSLSQRQELIVERVLKEITVRLQFLVDVGLSYLTLDRPASTLAGGERQRIRLASQVGSGLTGVLYILDEPSIGLHARDNAKLLSTLKQLRDLGNTVIVIEHDEETMRESDWIVDIGPGAGKQGGTIVASGPIESILAKSNGSLTGKYLRGEKQIAVPAERRAFNKRALLIRGAAEHNLKKLTVEIPLGLFVCVTGVSGSGKSTLVHDVLYKALAQKMYGALERPGRHSGIEGIENLDKVIIIDQSPIGRTPRSNPATYTGVFTPIRELFAATKDARIRGYGPGRFSFNVRGGRCEACSGEGFVKIEMQFLPDVYVPCDVCNGKRYAAETLKVQYKQKSIAEVLAMTVGEALPFFTDIPKIKPILKVLSDVGLDYIELGQPATTLSGGEAQRVKLSTELARRATGKTLYILDEPTTGLHFDDVNKLLKVLQRLTDGGNTVLVIEHNLDVVKSTDYIIDLGPEGGDAGGEVVAVGTPEEVAKKPSSHTGRFLRGMLKK